MKTKFLAAAASVAFLATGVAALAQESQNPNQRHEQRPAASGEARPGGAMHEQGAQQEPRGQNAQAQTERREQPNGAQGATPATRAEGQPAESKERPRAAEAPGQERKGSENRAAEQSPRETPAARTGANEPRNGAKTGPENQTGAAERDRNAPRTGANDTNQTGARTAQQGGQHGPAQVRGNVHMSSDHATRVSESLRRNAQPERFGGEVRVGARVPENIRIEPLPEDVIAIVPEYRGYDYFIDEDDEIVFVSPDSHEIVGMIDYEGRAASEDVTHVRAARPCPPED